jgi:phage terminase small subunit
MADKDLVLVSEQILLPGIPQRDPSIPPTRGKSGQRLTAMEKKFATNWINTHKVGQSAIDAGYSVKNAHSIGSRLLKKSQVSEFIKEREEEIIQAAGINRVDALKRLALMAYWNPQNLYREDGSVKGPSEWDDATCAVIAGIEVVELWERDGKKKICIGLTKKVKVVDPLAALKLLLEVLGLTKQNITGKDGDPMNPGCTQITNNTLQVVLVPGPGQEKALGPVYEMGEGKEGK